MPENDTDIARRLITIFGESLDNQLTNAEYMLSRGAGNAESVRLLRLAVAFRNENQSEGVPVVNHTARDDELRNKIARALHGHSIDTMSQDSGSQCTCGSDSRFEQKNGDRPWKNIDEHRADIILRAVKFGCPEGPHRPPEGPNEDISQCHVCWAPTYSMRPENEQFGLHQEDCSLPRRHESYCVGGGEGHPPTEVVRGFWAGMDEDIRAEKKRFENG